MSTPYFCTLCGRQHVRGKIYADHADYKRGADCPDHDEQMTIVNPTKNVTPARCLDCGVPFENQDNPSLDSWFECSECGATHVYWKGKWWLEDDADDHGRRAEAEMKGEIQAEIDAAKALSAIYDFPTASPGAAGDWVQFKVYLTNVSSDYVYLDILNGAGQYMVRFGMYNSQFYLAVAGNPILIDPNQLEWYTVRFTVVTATTFYVTINGIVYNNGGANYAIAAGRDFDVPVNSLLGGKVP